jgi:catalase (peroxidase I)
MGLEAVLVKAGATPEDIKKAVDAADEARSGFLKSEDKPSDKNILAGVARAFYMEIEKAQKVNLESLAKLQEQKNKIQNDFNSKSKNQVSIADLIVLGGTVGLEKSIKNYSKEELAQIDINELTEYTKGVIMNEKIFQILENLSH